MLKLWGVLSAAGVAILLVACSVGDSTGEPVAEGQWAPVASSMEVAAPTSTAGPTATVTPAPDAISTQWSPSPTPLPPPTPTVLPTATPDPATPTPRPTPATIRVPGDQSLAHDFEMALFGGGALKLSELRGQVVVLNFWASWCPPCRWEMPSFEGMYQEYRQDGVVFVGVAVSDFEEDARDFVELTGVSYPVGVDPGGVARDYRVLSLPTTVFIDRQGRVARTLKNVANEGVLRLFIKGQIGSGG